MWDLNTTGYLAGWALVRRLPVPVASWLFNRGADFASNNGRGLEQLRRNLARVVGQENVTAHLVRDAARSYARYWREAFCLPAIHADPQLHARLVASVRGIEHLDASVAAGRGVVLTLPHSGNWDMAGVFVVHRYGKFTTVAERLQPELLFDAFLDFRTQLGFEVLALTGDAPPFPHLKKVLEAGGIVALLGERDISDRGITVPFFGEESSLPAGPAQLARETGAALHVAHCWFESGDQPGWGMSVSPEIKVDELRSTVARIARHFEEGIRAHPADWHNFSTQWKSDLQYKD